MEKYTMFMDWENQYSENEWASLVVWWLILGASNSGDLGSVPGQGTRSHMPQLRAPMLQLKLGEANK